MTSIGAYMAEGQEMMRAAYEKRERELTAELADLKRENADLIARNFACGQQLEEMSDALMGLEPISGRAARDALDSVGGSAASLARKYDWISRQDDGVVRAADVAHDIRESFGIKGEDNTDERDVFASARTLPDPYDDRDGPYYDMKQVRKIKLWRDATMRVMRAAWALVDNTEGDANVNRQDWIELADALVALRETIPESERPAEPPHAVTLLWTDTARRLRLIKDELKWERAQRLHLIKDLETLSLGAVKDIASERRRQIEDEGFGPEHDDAHGMGEMAKAAAAYAYHTTAERAAAFAPAPYGTPYHERPPLELAFPPRSLWPWDVSCWKPTDRRRDLVKAGALILAEIERLDRVALASAPAVTAPPAGFDAHFDALRAAYRRGVAWARENGPDCDAYADKAAYDYADFQTGPQQSAPLAGTSPLERVRHVKRGTEYEVLGEAEAQVSTGHIDINGVTYTDIQDGSRLTVYRCLKTGKLWCRFTDEMRDGRFEPSRPQTKEAGASDARQSEGGERE